MEFVRAGSMTTSDQLFRSVTVDLARVNGLEAAEVDCWR